MDISHICVRIHKHIRAVHVVVVRYLTCVEVYAVTLEALTCVCVHIST
jgi:hypothetical protein